MAAVSLRTLQENTKVQNPPKKTPVLAKSAKVNSLMDENWGLAFGPFSERGRKFRYWVQDGLQERV